MLRGVYAGCEVYALVGKFIKHLVHIYRGALRPTRVGKMCMRQ